MGKKQWGTTTRPPEAGIGLCDGASSTLRRRPHSRVGHACNFQDGRVGPEQAFMRVRCGFDRQVIVMLVSKRPHWIKKREMASDHICSQTKLQVLRRWWRAWSEQDEDQSRADPAGGGDVLLADTAHPSATGTTCTHHIVHQRTSPQSNVSNTICCCLSPAVSDSALKIANRQKDKHGMQGVTLLWPSRATVS